MMGAVARSWGCCTLGTWGTGGASVGAGDVGVGGEVCGEGGLASAWVLKSVKMVASCWSVLRWTVVSAGRRVRPVGLRSADMISLAAAMRSSLEEAEGMRT